MVTGLTDVVVKLLGQLLAVPATPPTRLGPVLDSPEDLKRYLPTVVSTSELFVAFTPAQRELAIRQRLAKVRTDRNYLAESATSAGFNLSVLDRIAKVETSFKASRPFNPPLTGITGASDLSWLLQPDRGDTTVNGEQFRTLRAHTLLRQEEGMPVANRVDLSTVCEGPSAAASLLVELRRLHDVYSRFAVALRTHLETKEPVPRILALWRTEGDLNVPPSMASVKGTDVPSVAGELVELPSGRSNWRYHLGCDTPHFYTVVWLARRHSFEYESPECQQVDLTTEDNAHYLANAQFHFGIMGLDILFIPRYRDELHALPGSSSPYMTQEEWMARNWQQPGQSLDAAKSAAKAAYDARYQSLVLEERLEEQPTSNPPAWVWVVAPGDPISYTAGIVGEGARYLGRMIRKYPFLITTTPLPESLGYLTYHVGPHKVKAVFASALAASRTGNSAHAKALRASMTAVQVPNLKNVLDQIKASNTEQAINVAWNNWATVLQPVVQSGQTLQRIADYVLRASETEWRAYTDIRRNTIRYKRLLDFYTELFRSP
jgi:hypothetical protein